MPSLLGISAEPNLGELAALGPVAICMLYANETGNGRDGIMQGYCHNPLLWTTDITSDLVGVVNPLLNKGYLGY